MFKYFLIVALILMFSCKVTEYKFCNESSYELIEFSSYYWDGDNILDDQDHGNLLLDECTVWVETERTEIKAAALVSSILCIFTDDFIPVEDEQTIFNITDSSNVYCGD